MKFFQHQSAIVSQNPTKTGLWLGTGGGKTRIALAMARGKTLVICPKTQKLDRNWERECDKMRADDIELKITYDVHPTNRANNLKRGHAYPTVISKEELRKDPTKYAGRYNTIIVDEAETCLGVTPNIHRRSRPKGPIEELQYKIYGQPEKPKASQLYEALYYVIHGVVPPDRLYLCTATITRTPMTVWAAGTILGKKWNWYKWRQAFYTRLPMPGREVWAPKSDSKTKDRLAAAVRDIGFVGRLEDWFDVPDQQYRNDYLELSEAQKTALAEVKLDYPDPIVALGKRLQVENGTLSGDEFTKPQRFKHQKIDRILHYAEEFPKMIIWAKFTEQINYYYDELKKKGYNVYTLTGETKDREALFQSLQTSDQAILIAQAQISAGWEWKECPISIFTSRTYSIADYEQALGRTQRVNALKKNLYINLITRGGVDEAVNKSLENKKDFSERVYLGL